MELFNPGSQGKGTRAIAGSKQFESTPPLVMVWHKTSAMAVRSEGN